MQERVTIEQANIVMQQAVKPITEKEEVSLEKAINRTLYKAEKALFDQPPFPRSPIDGYACNASDTLGASKEKPVILKVIAEVQAGQVFEGKVKSGQAIRIMTGAQIPDGCDCCIRQEDTDYGEVEVQLYQPMRPHQNYCYAGEDYHKGQVLLPQYTTIGHIELGILASMGRDTVEVFRKPKIALITTGDELLLPEQELENGKIYNSNRYLLLGRLMQLGIMPLIIKHLSDDADDVAKQLQTIKDKVDIIITTGGVSVGKKDIFHDALKIAKAKKIFWKVQVKPGSPTIFSTLDTTPIVSLSGNPFGALVNFELLVRPMLYALTRNTNFKLEKNEVVLGDDFLKESKGRRVIRASYENGLVFLPNKHASGILSSAINCNCLVDIPKGSKGLKKGEKVTVWKL